MVQAQNPSTHTPKPLLLPTNQPLPPFTAVTMAKVPLPLKRFLLLGNRRWYGIEAESAAVQPSAVSAVRKEVDSATAAAPKTEGAEKQKEGFWMKDPKTGNWIPQTHFDDIDVAALREKHLPAGKHPF